MTATCAYIQPINIPNSDVICVSLQRLSRCTGQRLKSAQPWLGHGKTRRHQVRQTTRLPSEHDDNNDSISDQVSGSEQQNNGHTKTRAGRTVRRPQRFLDNSFPDGSASEVGGGCKGRITRPSRAGGRT